jgi:hypothetical protein
MTGMSPNQARVVDPVLTTHARGYRNANFIFDEVAPTVDIPAAAARVLAFRKDDFRLMATRRASGGDVPVVEFGYESDPISMHQDALDASVRREVQEETSVTVPGLDLGARAVDKVTRIIDLGHEKATADKVTNPATYPTGNKIALAGTDRWNDAASSPSEQVEDGKLTVASRIGQEPNRLFLGRDVFSALRFHPKILDHFKYTSADMVTEAVLAKYFDVEKVVVGRAVYLPAGAGEDTPASFVWAGLALLAFVNPTPTWDEPSFAYTYRRRGYPIVEQPYWHGPSRSHRYGVTQQRAPVICGAEAGFLFQTPIG